MTTRLDERAEVWSRYWATGMPHSCGSSYGPTYGGRLAAFWHDSFSGLSPRDRVLDVATGNGALPRMLVELSGDNAPACDAVDIASVAPAWHAALPSALRERIRFHSGVAVEALPFQDASFRLVASQYGIEYSDLARSVPEVARVLSIGGQLRLVVHHVDALPVRLAAREVEHIDWLCGEGQLLDAASALIAPVARSVTAQGRTALAVDTEANARRVHFNALQDSLAVRLLGDACPTILLDARQWVSQVLGVAARSGESSANEAIATVRQSLADARLRLQELQACALDKSSVQALGAAWESVGCACEHEPLMDGNHLLGWSLVGVRG